MSSSLPVDCLTLDSSGGLSVCACVVPSTWDAGQPVSRVWHVTVWHVTLLLPLGGGRRIFINNLNIEEYRLLKV